MTKTRAVFISSLALAAIAVAGYGYSQRPTGATTSLSVTPRGSGGRTNHSLLSRSKRRAELVGGAERPTHRAAPSCRSMTTRNRASIRPAPRSPQATARFSTTAIRWACPTPRRCRRRIRWGWTTSPSMTATSRATARPSRSASIACSAAACAPSRPRRACWFDPVRAVGTVAIDERRATIVTMRSDGYVEDLFVNTTGQNVRAGEPLFRVYSPDIQQAFSRFAGGQELVRYGGNGPGTNRVDGAMQRLRNLGVPEARIREIRDSGSNPRTLDWLAPADGTVIVKRIDQRPEDRCRRRTLSHRRSDESLGDRRRRGRRSRRHQARRPCHRHLPRLSQPAGRGYRHLHLSGGEDGDAHRAGAHRSRQSGRAAEARHVCRRGVPRR